MITSNDLQEEQTNVIEFQNSTISFNISHDQGVDVLVRNNLTNTSGYLNEGNNYSTLYSLNLINVFEKNNIRRNLTISTYVNADLIESKTYYLLLVASEPDLLDENITEYIHTESDESSVNIEKVLKEVRDKNSKELIAESTSSLEEIKKNNNNAADILKKLKGQISAVNGFLELSVKQVIVQNLDGADSIGKNLSFETAKKFLLSSFEIVKSKTINSKDTSLNTKEIETKYYLQVKNTALRHKAMLSIEALEALKSFDKVVSVLLTEPYLYCSDEIESKEELSRIQKVFSSNVLPIYYQCIESGVLGCNHVTKITANNFQETIKRELKSYINKINVNEGSFTEGVIELITGALEVGGGFAMIGSIIGSIMGVGSVALGGLTLNSGYEKIMYGYPNAAANISRAKKGLEELSYYLNENKLHYSADEYSRVLNLFEIESIDSTNLSNSLNNLLIKNIKKFGDSKQISSLIDTLANKLYPSFPCFRHFRSMCQDIGAGSKLEELLNTRKSLKSELNDPLNFYSKEIGGGGLYDYLYYLLAFPYSFVGIDESRFKEIFNVYTDGKHYSVNSSVDWLAYNESAATTKPRRDDVNYETLTNIQTVEIRKWIGDNTKAYKKGNYIFSHWKKPEGLKINFEYDTSNDIGKDFYKFFFEKNRETLKSDQNKKMKYLLAVKGALLEQVIASNAEYFYDSPQFKKYVENFSNASLFEIMDDSAYPDIDLPKIDIKFDKVKKMNPAFYYFNPEINSSIEDSKTLKIIKSSKDFKDRVKEGIISSKSIDLNPRKSDRVNRKDLLNKSQLINVSEISLENIPKSGFPKGTSKVIDPGSSDTNEIKVSNNEVDVENQTQIRLPDLKINTSSFDDEEQLKNYIKSFQKQISEKKEDVKKLERMFGGREYSKIEGFINEGLEKSENSTIKSFFKKLSSNMDIGKDLENYSSEKTLLELHAKSYEDFFNQDGMKRAFPTFRLYLVEEDSIFSGKLTAYDDFYNYASVISFDVNIDRELSASTASIQLQNVSGILDGTKKEVLRDVDVNRREIDSKNDDKYEALIESIVLRPGINVQLRAGYENDTKDLDILISGRITDISHGPDGMTTNIIVQSYGVELEQQVKSAKAAKKDKLQKYYTTHQLLGSLMLSPELKHFGRIKVGKIFQTGEDKAVSLEVKDYSNQSSFTLEYTTSFLSKLSENGHIVALGVAILPTVFKWGGAAISKFGLTRSIAAGISRSANLTNQFFGKYSNAVLSTLSQAKLVKYVGKRLGAVGPKLKISSSGSSKLNTLEVNSLLTNLKNGVELTAKNESELARIMGTLDDTIVSNIDDLVGTGATAAVKTESYIMAHVLRNEGMLFTGIKNYSFAALGNAKAALINATTGVGLNFGQRSLSYIYNATTIGAFVLGSLSLIPVLIDGFNLAWDAIKGKASDLYSELFDSKRDDTLRILLSPQDDNLFIPDPKTYLVSKKSAGNAIAIGTHIKNYMIEYGNALAFNVPYIVQGYAGWELLKSESYANKKLKELKQIFDTRLIIEDSENEYILKEQTIFKVFHEMSLRHPGYIYGARPYGRSMEYRMFFGLPNQNYWAKDISTVDAIRLNKIVSDLSKGDLLSIETCKSLYKSSWEGFSDLTKRREFYLKYKSKNLQKYNTSDIAKKSTTGISDKQIRTIITKHAMDEYLKKTKDRFTPFRKMHSLNSEKNIVSNNVTVSSHDIINSVTVYYNETYSNNSEGKYSLEMAANTAIKQHNVKQKAVHNPNIVGPGCAYRYGIGELLYGAKKLYTGSILSLGNPKINPWDVIILNDNVNRMHGPLEVKAVTHSFNHQTGFLTDIEVNALVSSGEDMLTYPAITSSIIAEAREKMYADFSSKIAFEASNTDDKMYKRIIRKLIKERFPKNKYGKEIQDDLQKYYMEELKNNLNEAAKNDEPVFLQDIISPNATLPQGLKRRIESVAGTGLGITAGLGISEIGVSLAFGRTPGVTNLRNPIGWGFAALTGVFSALYLSSDSALGGIESSLNSGFLGKNLFRPVLFSKISNQNLIEVYPIVKDGKPLLTGGFENIPAEQTYKNVIGNIFSMVSDGYKGYLEVESQIDSGGPLSVLDWEDEDDFVEVTRGQFFEMFKGSNKGSISKELYYYGLKEN